MDHLHQDNAARTEAIEVAPEFRHLSIEWSCPFCGDDASTAKSIREDYVTGRFSSVREHTGYLPSGGYVRLLRILVCVLAAACLTACGAQPESQQNLNVTEQEPPTEAAWNPAADAKILLSGACAFSRFLDGTITVREASAQAEVAVDRILQYTGLPKNFVLAEANIDNAAATIVRQNRIILYDAAIIGRSDWATIGILAHEIGHHLSGHTLRAEGRLEDELEADRFAGFILGKMGATGSEAEQMMDQISDPSRSPTHPPRARRVAAIRSGWGTASTQVDRRSPLINPGDLPEGVTEEYVFMYETSGCSMSVFQGTVVRTIWGSPSRLGTAVEIELDLDGPGRETFWVQESDLTKIARNHLLIIAQEGRRVEIENAACGSGGFESVSRIKALPPL